jgi:hypothetical protein
VPYVLGRSLLVATCCVPLSSCGNIRGGVFLVVGWQRRVKCVSYFYTRTHLNTKKKKKIMLKSRCCNEEVLYKNYSHTETSVNILRTSSKTTVGKTEEKIKC